VLFTNFGGDEELASLRLLAEVRAAGVAAEIYPENKKMGKQMEYANRRSIPYVVIVGGNELAEGRATVKNMIEGSQESVEFARLAEYLA
jgi:histidyl-tRNA synthetase